MKISNAQMKLYHALTLKEGMVTQTNAEEV